MPLVIGQLLQHRYQINALLGQGGMGAVYDGWDSRLNIRCAIKENQLPTEEAQRQFEREARLLASLRHSNLPRVTDHFVIPGEGQYLVMDFVAGDDLKQIMDKAGAQPEANVVQWAEGVLDALAYLHGRNVIHRDIKPANIKITPDGNAVLVDFGIAKDVSANAGVTTTGARALTPGFASPEQYGMQRTDARTDIYALGATMYTLLSGEAPADALSRMMKPEKFVPLTRRELNVSHVVTEAIDKAIMLSEEDRFQSAAEMKLALHGETLPTLVTAPTVPNSATLPIASEAKPPVLSTTTPRVTMPRVTAPLERGATEPPQSASPSRPNPLMQLFWIIGGGIVLIVLGIALTGNWGRVMGLFAAPTLVPAAATTQPTEPPTAQPSEAPTESATLEPTVAPTTAALPTSTAAPPTSTAAPTAIGGGAGEIVFISNRDGNFEIYSLKLGRGGFVEPTRLTDVAAEDRAPLWSPDGSKIVFQTKRHGKWEIYMLNADGSEPTRLTTNDSDDISPSWSPDGKQIAFISFRDGNREVYVMNADGSDQFRLTGTLAGEDSPVWSPDGTKLAFVSNRDGHWQIYVMNVDGSDQIRLSTNAQIDDLGPKWSPDGKQILFYSNRDGNQEIYAMASADGADPKRLTTNEANDYEPSWSPDGTQVAFVSERDVNPEIYVMVSADGSKPTRLTSNLGPDLSPVWQP